MSDSLLLGRKWWWEEVGNWPRGKFLAVWEADLCGTLKGKRGTDVQVFPLLDNILEGHDQKSGLHSTYCFSVMSLSVPPWYTGILPRVIDTEPVAPQKIKILSLIPLAHLESQILSWIRIPT